VCVTVGEVLDGAVLSEAGAGARKARGAYFTPAALCRFVAAWAIDTPDARVLEPSAGEAAFLLAAAARLRELNIADGAGLPSPDGGYPIRVGSDSAGDHVGSGRIQRRRTGGHLAGVELHADSVTAARATLQAAGHDADLRVANFFALPPSASFDAVIGNPPYVRYQDFTGHDRALAKAAALRAGVRISNLASSWAAFTVHAALFLKPGGRLGLVLPGELLSVNYAAQVREFLMRRFGRVRIVVFTERVFPGVLEEVVLLLAEGEGPTNHCELAQVRDLDALGAPTAAGHATSRWSPGSSSDKWTGALAPRRAAALLGELSAGPFGTLGGWGETTLGMVTGANRYFALSPDAVQRLGLTPDDVIALSPPGSRHLRTLTLTPARWRELGASGGATLLFRPAVEPSRAARRYLRDGEAAGVPDAYKCRVRSPWWRVPLVRPADLLLTYMNADTPRLCTNDARVHHLNSVHGVYLNPGLRGLGALLPLVALNSATALGAELVGRSYGGGMLKLEPREADRLPLPSPAVVRSAAPALRGVRSQVAAQLAAGAVGRAVELVDEVLLAGACGLDGGQVAALRDAVRELRGRRLARGARPRGEARERSGFVSGLGS
jgi:hypothetical protein